MMIIRIKIHQLQFLVISALVLGSVCYEKTLRKIVRNQSKMVQKPFSDNNIDLNYRNISHLIPQQLLNPGYTQVNSIIHKMQRPKISTILSSIDTGRSKTMFSRMNIARNENMNSFELRMARDAITDAIRETKDNFIFPDNGMINWINQSNINFKSLHSVSGSTFFPSLDEVKEHDTPSKENSILIPDNTAAALNSSIYVKGIFMSSINSTGNETNTLNTKTPRLIDIEYDRDIEKADFLIEELPNEIETIFETYNSSELPYICTAMSEAKADIDAQEKYSQLDIEPPWTVKRQFWSQVYESRYESLMRNPKWPPLKVILVPRSQVHTIWKRSFESLHNHTVRRIISNIIKKLQFYQNSTFSWNEVSHLSQWWLGARQKSRAALLRLIKEGRLEITTGMWVETDESTSHLFGIIHQLMEGHQWLQHHLNYSPEVAWLTNSVTHSPTLPYLLSASGISNLVLTNLHYSWQQYLTEYQYTDFIWIQNWDNDKSSRTKLNDVLNKIGNDQYSKYSILSHYLPYNFAGFEACGPQGEICASEFNFANNNNNLDINTFNVKEKSERLLEQYSKTGTTSSHNVLIAPLGNEFHYELQTEFDYQYNNYEKIAEFVNSNSEIYKTTIEFGTSKDYFNAIMATQTSFPTLKGDFLNYADIKNGNPAYWTGFFTSRPQFKILLRRLQSTLRSTEILFSFALNNDMIKTYNASKLFELLLNAREVVARLQDRNVVSGTLTSKTIKYVHSQILHTAKNCWYIQEVSASFLSSKPDQNITYLEKYVYREGEFISSFKSITPGDQIYIFNSLNQERTEIIELITRYPNLRIMDHNKKELTIQVNPIWQYSNQNKNKIKISRQFFKVVFVTVVPPLALELFKIKKTYDNTLSRSTIYCMSCEFDDKEKRRFSFEVLPIEPGDIQLENYKHRLIFDEYTGFLKTVVEKSTNTEIALLIDFGAFKSSHINSGMFLFNTNYTKPLEDILSPYRINFKSTAVMIISGQITTELITIYGALVQHSVKIFNLFNSPLSNAIKIETKVDYEVSPKNRELEIFMSVQTDVSNGYPPEFTLDNNGFQYTSRTVNVSRRVESNMYPMTNMVYIQDNKRRLTVITDHAQGVTALQEGQIVVMLDRRVLFNDGRGSEEGLADSSATYHTHYLLLESFIEPRNKYDEKLSKNHLKLPSLAAIYLASTLNYQLDVFYIDIKNTNFCYYAFRPLVKKSFPCDVTLINYRVVINRGTPIKYSPNTALMTLHRQSFTCLIDHEINIHCSGEDQLRLNKIFYNVKAIYQTNLVGTTEGVPMNILNKGNFPPMEITTLRIYF